MLEIGLHFPLLLCGFSDCANMRLVSMQEGSGASRVKASLTQLLRERRKLASADEDNFNVLDTKQLAETLSGTTRPELRVKRLSAFLATLAASTDTLFRWQPTEQETCRLEPVTRIEIGSRCSRQGVLMHTLPAGLTSALPAFGLASGQRRPGS